MARAKRTRSATELTALRSVRRRSPLAAIRARCVDCCAGCAKEVELCDAKNCPSWPYRFGVDPWSADAELPPKVAVIEPALEPSPPAPAVQVTKFAPTAKRTWRQHSAVYVDNVGQNSKVRGSAQATPKVGRGDDAAGMLRNTGMSVVSVNTTTEPVARQVAAPPKRRRGRPRKQMGLFDAK